MSEFETSAGENVRRPLYGIRVKENKFAYISVMQAGVSGGRKPISMLDSSAPAGAVKEAAYSTANHNFFLQKVSISRQEKTQIVETFGDHFVFFYGERPIIIQCQGMLINTADFNWKNEWLHNYENYLRGTRCVETKSRVYLAFDDVLCEGYLLGTNVAHDENLPHLCPFGFQMLLTNYQDLSDPYVKAAGDARVYGSISSGGAVQTDIVAEYLEAPSAGAVRYVVDPITGIAAPDTGSDASAGLGNTPASIADGTEETRSAHWISGRNPATRQWKTEEEALVALDMDLAAAQEGADRVTTALAFRKTPGDFQLTGRSTAALLRTALGSGVAGAAVVVDDAPLLG